MKLRNSLRTFAAAGLILGAVAVSAGSASAAGKDGWLEAGEFGLFCTANQGNSVFDLYTSDGYFPDDFFKGSQSCAGHTTDDYTESYHNRDTFTWDVYTDPQRGGYQTHLNPTEKGNFNSLYGNKLSSAYIRL
ncbi:hypothetical protein [Streptomyces sp. AP-93]|uniref:hypothetical protein n=1 Tax=Streptomyces sp. AP-93 TaxID=2929048 RepID=UPI001FAE89EB|nr:hypothetical protein [Streptomyces sp. AP-93]MCJ0871132.1 hypothetical protein [Streptomyces sp. AP-93]